MATEAMLVVVVISVAVAVAAVADTMAAVVAVPLVVEEGPVGRPVRCFLTSRVCGAVSLVSFISIGQSPPRRDPLWNRLRSHRESLVVYPAVDLRKCLV